MRIATNRFGRIDVDPADILHFPSGLPGLEDCRDWALLADSDNDALGWLQSTTRGDVALAVESMKAGAVDFIEKPFDDEALLCAIRIAFRKGSELVSASPERQAIVARLDALSPREREVLAGVVAGKPNKIIAHDLGISPRTVEVYRANLMTKMAAGSLSELVRMALVAGH